MRHAKIIGIGSASFGQKYGLLNTEAIITSDEVSKVLSCARANGIKLIDTAPTYGNAEQIIGAVGAKDWEIVSKISPIPDDSKKFDIGDWLKAEVFGTLNRLGIDCLHGLLLHRPEDILTVHGSKLIRELKNLQLNGHIKKIGFSIYSPDELEKLTKQIWPDLVQAPLNAFDRRIITSGWLERLVQNGTEIHVRSVFLQGLLLSEKMAGDKYFKKWRAPIGEWHNYLRKMGISPLEGAIYSVVSNSKINKIILGVNSLEHLKQILEAFNRVAKYEGQEKEFTISYSDPDLVDPRRWVINDVVRTNSRV
jgi:hypothetical protein